MNKSTTIILLILLAALAAIVYFTKGDADKGRRDSEDMIPGYEVEKVKLLRIENGERNEKLVLSRSKTDGEWEMLEPIHTAAEKAQADFLARYFKDFKGARIGKLGDANVKPDALGFDKPRAMLDIEGVSEKPVSVKIGADNPLKKGDLFLLVGDVAYQAPRTIYNTIAKPAGKFRDDRVFTLPSLDLTQMEISMKGATAVLEREATTWKLASPIKGRADAAAAGKIATSIANMKISSFESDNPGDLSQYGLDNPGLVITFKAKDKSQTVKFGRVDADQRTFAMRDGIASVWKVPESDVAVGRKSADDLRDAQVFGAISRDSLKTIKWKSEIAGEIEISYEAASHKAKLTKPREAEIDRVAFDELVKSLEGMKAASMATLEGAAPPAAGYLELLLKDATVPLRVETGAASAGVMDMKRPGDDYLLKVPAESAAFFSKKISQIVSKDIVSIDSYIAGRVEIDINKDGRKKSLVYAKNAGNLWTLPGAQEESSEFANLTDLLWHAKAQEVTDLEIKDSPLAQPAVELRVFKKLADDVKPEDKEKDRIATIRYSADASGAWIANGVNGAGATGGFVMKVGLEIPEKILKLAFGETASKPSAAETRPASGPADPKKDK
ncbi:MAG: DUF4340 domain-containing protein [Planctomycetes bacterium]|nr:DUF4340 domain-containing protein [Planctomycetota bacterium]